MLAVLVGQFPGEHLAVLGVALGPVLGRDAPHVARPRALDDDVAGGELLGSLAGLHDLADGLLGHLAQHVQAHGLLGLDDQDLQVVLLVEEGVQLGGALVLLGVQDGAREGGGGAELGVVVAVLGAEAGDHAARGDLHRRALVHAPVLGVGVVHGQRGHAGCHGALGLRAQVTVRVGLEGRKVIGGKNLVLGHDITSG